MRKTAREAAGAAACVVIGAAALLGVLEAGLSAAAALRSRPAPASGAETYTVLCLGDSFTYGMGGESYPDQLGRRLAAAGLRVRVINRGIAGINSAQLAERADDELARHRPDAVVVVVGADNFWNSLPIEGGALRRLNLRLLSLRSYRLIRLLWVGVSEGSLRGRYRRDAPASREEAMDVLRASLESEHLFDWFRLQLGDRPDGPRVEAARRSVAAALAADPGDARARLLLARLALDSGDAAGAERLFLEGLGAGPCEPSFFSGLAAARQRQGDESGARRALDGEGRPERCAPQLRTARAEWLLWRGEAREAVAAYRRALAGSREPGTRASVLRGLAQALYRSADYEGAIARLEEAEKLAPGDGGEGGLLSQAWARKWERARRYGSSAPPPAALGGERIFSHYNLGEYAQCSDRALEALRQEPSSEYLFHMHALCLQRQGRLWEALAAPAGAPAVSGNLFYRYLSGVKATVESRGRTLEALSEERFEADVLAIARAARRHGAQALFSSYPEEEYPPVRRAARAAGAAYLDLVPLFKARFRSRDEFLSSDRCHLTTAGYGVMAEAVEKALRGLPGFPAEGSR